MKRSLFTKSLMFGGLGLFGCSGDSRENNPEAETNRGNLKFYGMPSKGGAELITSILPNKVFRAVEKPSPTVHPDKIPSIGHEGENRREWYARYRAEIAEYARKLSDAESYFERLKLHPPHYDLLTRLSEIQREQKRQDLSIAYDVIGDPGRISSLDLTGARFELSRMSFSDPDDPFCVGPTPSVNSESFDELLKVRHIRRLFLNYADAPFPKFLELVNQYDDF